MDPSNPEKQVLPEGPRLLDFPHLPNDATHPDGTPRLNKYSSTITKNHDFPGAQVWMRSNRMWKTLTDQDLGHVVCCWCAGP